MRCSTWWSLVTRLCRQLPSPSRSQRKSSCCGALAATFPSHHILSFAIFCLRNEHQSHPLKDLRFSLAAAPHLISRPTISQLNAHHSPFLSLVTRFLSTIPSPSCILDRGIQTISGQILLSTRCQHVVVFLSFPHSDSCRNMDH